MTGGPLWWHLFFGKIYLVDEQTILYRQHSNNAVGAKNSSITDILSKISSREYKQSIDRLFFVQSEILLDNYRDTMNAKDVKTAEKFMNIRGMNYISKIRTIIQYGFYKHGFMRNAGLFFFYITIYKTV